LLYTNSEDFPFLPIFSIIGSATGWKYKAAPLFVTTELFSAYLAFGKSDFKNDPTDITKFESCTSFRVDEYKDCPEVLAYAFKNFL